MPTKKRPKPARVPPAVPIEAKLRWTLGEAAAMCGFSPGYVTELIGKDQFPPRARVHTGKDDPGGKLQFVASEVRAWADGRDWRALVAARLACG